MLLHKSVLTKLNLNDILTYLFLKLQLPDMTSFKPNIMIQIFFFIKKYF